MPAQCIVQCPGSIADDCWIVVVIILLRAIMKIVGTSCAGLVPLYPYIALYTSTSTYTHFL